MAFHGYNLTHPEMQIYTRLPGHVALKKPGWACMYLSHWIEATLDGLVKPLMSHSGLRKVPHVVRTERLILVSWLGRMGESSTACSAATKTSTRYLEYRTGPYEDLTPPTCVPLPWHLSKPPQAHRTGGQKEHQPPSTEST